MNPLSIIAFLLLIGFSMFFSASETAFASIAAHKVDSLIKQRKIWAKALRKVKANPDSLLMAILIGNNIVNIAAATLATTISISLAAQIWYNESTIVMVSTIVVTVLIIIFGEITPKTFAIRNAEKLWLLISPFYVNFIKILFPIIWILNWVNKTMSKKREKAEISPEEIEAFIEMSKNAGAFEETEYKQIKNLLSFGEVTVEEAMTPRIKINAISDAMTVDTAIDKLLTLHHTRIPVYHKTIDDAEKVITLRELINFKQENSGDLPLKELPLNPITKLPSPTPADVAMNAFKKSHKHIALVMDEYGGVAGLITLEDIIEEIFGEIQDENDIETMPIKKQGRNSRIVQSFVRIDEFLDESGLTREEIWIDEEAFDGETLSHLLTSLLERFPVEGEEISLKVYLLPVDKHSEERLEKTLTMKVLQIVGNTIGDVKISIG